MLELLFERRAFYNLEYELFLSSIREEELALMPIFE